jgi:hypothetical protein
MCVCVCVCVRERERDTHASSKPNVRVVLVQSALKPDSYWLRIYAAVLFLVVNLLKINLLKPSGNFIYKYV